MNRQELKDAVDAARIKWLALHAEAMKATAGSFQPHVDDEGIVAWTWDETDPEVAQICYSAAYAHREYEELHAQFDSIARVNSHDPDTSHADDFTSVSWFGTHYQFSKGNQSNAVRVLWEAYERGGHGCGEEKLGELIGSSADRFRLRNVFRGKDAGQHPAWDSMIKSTGKGVYALVPPENLKNTE